jgi:hypothetical protein
MTTEEANNWIIKMEERQKRMFSDIVDGAKLMKDYDRKQDLKVYITIFLLTVVCASIPYYLISKNNNPETVKKTPIEGHDYLVYSNGGIVHSASCTNHPADSR